MGYEFFSEEELRHEVELVEKQTLRLRQQLERLLSLKAEGKVSDTIFKDVLEEIANRYNSFVPKVNDLRRSVEATLDRVREEDKELRYNLENLEVRFTIGSIPEDQYKVNRASYMMRLQNMEEFSRALASSFSSINENANKLSSALMQVRQTIPKEPPSGAGVVPTLTGTEPEERAVPSAIPSVQPVRVRTPSERPPAVSGPKGSQAPKPKVCPKCSAENQETSLYCYNCGAKLS